MKFASLFLLLSACAPTLPPHFLESSEVLPAKAVGILAGGGFGDMGGKSFSGQPTWVGEGRVRVGVGARQEVGTSVYGAVSFGEGTSTSHVFGAKLEYKVAPASFLAFVAGAGGLTLDGKLRALGGDVAVVVSPYTSRNGHRMYTGARGAFAIPLFPDARGATEGVTLPLGVAIRATDDVRVFLEAGLLVGGAQFSSPSFRGDSNVLWGPYAAAGAQLNLR